MRIGTTNVLGLKGCPPMEIPKELGDPDSEKAVAHFERCPCAISHCTRPVSRCAVERQESYPLFP